MGTNRVERNLDAFLEGASPAERPLPGDAPVGPRGGLTARRAVRLFEDQALSRAIDVAARELRRRDQGFYTISSAGHEQNGVLGAILRPTDPCFLHYRSGALMMARARQAPGETPLFDTLLSLCASREDPIAGGRHKVWGSRRLWVPPQTSTIASHLPKAVGCAFALGRARRLGIETGLPRDTIVCCSFGDASINHATALAGINSARYAQRRGNPMPLLFLCEDNGIGISVDTPPRWVAEAYSGLKHLRYFAADGSVDEVWAVVEEAVEACRAGRRPVFLHLRCVRLWGHAGSDVEAAYRPAAEIEAIEASDPLLANARRLVETGAATPAQLAALVRNARERAGAAAAEAARRPRLASREEVIAPLAPYDEERCRTAAAQAVPPDRRAALWPDGLPEDATAPTKRTLAAHIHAALADLMALHPEMIVFGEDVGKKGGVYHVTADLQRKFGQARVFDTLLDETTILGVAQGAAHVGLLPVPEIQYLAYVHNAVDQLRGEACSLSWFSSGSFENPMVVRIASFAYQKGFGGHFHNDNAIGGLRDIPGIVLAAPSRGDDAARMLRGCISLARECGRIVCFLEPIALYHEKDLHEPGDAAWLFPYPPPGEACLPDDVGVYGDGTVLVVSYANGLRLSLRATRGMDVRVLDVRWLNPLPLDRIEEHARQSRGVVVVDECRATGGGIADAVVAHLAERGVSGPVRSVRAADCYVPLGPAADTVLVSEEQIAAAVEEVSR